MGRLYIEMDQNQEVLYKQVNADPKIVLTWLNREVVKLLEESENIYGVLKDLDEELVLKALLEGMEKKKAQRLYEKEKIKMKKEKKEARLAKEKKLKKNHLNSAGPGAEKQCL